MNTWRSIGSNGERYPDWFRALVSSSGVYAIREGGRVVYVGESHAGRLKKTIARHFQAWGRSPKGIIASLFSWGGSSTPGDPGRTYNRSRCEVRFEVLRARDKKALHVACLKKQAEWIKSLRPRDNVQGKELPREPRKQSGGGRYDY